MHTGHGVGPRVRRSLLPGAGGAVKSWTPLGNSLTLVQSFTVLHHGLSVHFGRTNIAELVGSMTF